MFTFSRRYSGLFACGFVLQAVSALAQISIQGGTLEPNRPSNSAQDTNHPSQLSLEFDMTPAEVSRLLASVDEVLARDSKITGLPIRGPVERKMTSRDEIRELTKKRMQDTDINERVRRNTAVLMKFGFLPRDFDVQQFAAETTVNQLAGYYDPHVKTMYLLNWLPTSAQIPVMAHELDHALQDQNFHLEDWMKKDDPAANAATGGDSSEQEAARRAVVEGQATAVMMEYLLSQQGFSLADMPAIPLDRVQALVERFTTVQTTQVVPLTLQEELAFPYLYGLRFVHQVLLKAGREQAYSGLFRHPPDNTRQIMEPAVYLKHEKLPPLPLPPFEDVLGKQFERIESGSIGEFDCMNLMKQFNRTDAQEVATHWRGDYFFAAKQSASANTNTTNANSHDQLKPEDVALIFVSRWETPAAAHAFANFYGEAFPRKYPNAHVITQASEGSVWATSEGRVAAEVHGNLVLVMESVDAEAASRITASVLKMDIH